MNNTGSVPGMSTLTYPQARAHWPTVRAQYVIWANELQVAVLAIPDSVQRTAVAVLIDTCAEGCGRFMVRQTEGLGFVIDHLDVDDDVYNLLMEQIGDLPLRTAMSWLETAVVGKPAPWVAWAIGSLQLQDIEKHKGKDVKFIVNHVVYSFLQQKIIGISLDRKVLGRVVRIDEL